MASLRFRHAPVLIGCGEQSLNRHLGASMGVIKRGVGFTPTEQKLAALADNMFLNLWSYPNLFNKEGKELCDLFVVCGDDILIFSDKAIDWPKGDDLNLSRPRWYRRAIEELTAQLNGAARYLRDHSDQLFLDAACKEKFPLTLPPAEHRRVHHVSVALGAAEACADYYKQLPGYLAINPDLKGAGHTNAADPGFKPFSIGDVQPDGSFVHVFNEPALELLGAELDTITDFTRYLSRRERIFRSGHLGPVAGEHDLLGQYLLSSGPDQDHDFIRPGGGEWQNGEKLQIPAGTYAGLAARPEYRARTEADKRSYAWDHLLGQFTAAILAGETKGVLSDEPNTAETEQGLRSMALEPRLRRRLLGSSVIEAITKAEAQKVNHFARSMIPGEHSVDETVGYVLLILAHYGEAPGDAYTEYRKRRLVLLHGYCLNLLRDNRGLKRAVGIGIDASSKVTGRKGGSEDFYVLEIRSWTPELEKRADDFKKDFNLLNPDNLIHNNADVDEFPRKPTLIFIIKPDGTRPKMWRVQFPDGRLTDMVNYTRAKDAARSLSRLG